MFRSAASLAGGMRRIIACSGRQPGSQPSVEIGERVFLRHEYARAMAARAQPLLVELAHAPVLRNDKSAELEHVLELFRMPLGDARRKEPVDRQCNLLWPRRHDTDATHVVRV